MKVEDVPKEAIEKVRIRNYQLEERKIQGNIEVTIFLEEDHELAEEVENDVIMMKADILNAVELDNLREKIGEE